MTRKIIILPGDSTGEEIMRQSIRVLDFAAKQAGNRFEYIYDIIGKSSEDITGKALLKETLRLSRASDAVLLGPISPYGLENEPDSNQSGIVQLRRGLGIFASVDQVHTYISPGQSPIKTGEHDLVNIMIYRDASEGTSGHTETSSNKNPKIYESARLSENDLMRVARLAYKSAARRKQTVTVVTGQEKQTAPELWNTVIGKLAPEFPEVLTKRQSETAVIHTLLNDPLTLDVVLAHRFPLQMPIGSTENLKPSFHFVAGADIGAATPLFSPRTTPSSNKQPHDNANLFPMILSVALMLDHFGMEAEAVQIRKAVWQCIRNHHVTKEMNPLTGLNIHRVGDFVMAYLES